MAGGAGETSGSPEVSVVAGASVGGQVSAGAGEGGAGRSGRTLMLTSGKWAQWRSVVERQARS